MAHKHTSKSSKRLADYGNCEFCRLFGDSLRNQVLCVFLENDELDTALADVIEQTGISKPAVYAIGKELVAQGIIMPSKKIGQTQLYIIDRKNKLAQQLLSQFKQSLESVAAKYDVTRNTAMSQIREIVKKSNLSREDLKKIISIATNAL